LKLDLHTHCREATACPTPTVDIVEQIVTEAKRKGLDGIAITEHYTDYYGYEVREIVENHFNGEITIIPGKEIDKLMLAPDRGYFHQVELYLPGDLTFRFIAHPGHPYVKDFASLLDNGVHGSELRNNQHIHQMDKEAIIEFAEEHNLILLSNSDAHKIGEIGMFHNEIEIEELCARVRAG